ncbi:MAG: hypothetical protein ABIJ95_03080 [Pseudomonadota bacterium]
MISDANLISDFCLQIKKYRTNTPYANLAAKEFVRKTTSTDLKKTMTAQAFWDKVFRFKTVRNFLATRLESGKTIHLTEDTKSTGTFDFSSADFEYQARIIYASPSHIKIRTCIKVAKGKLCNASFNLGFALADWEEDNFICAPGAAYSANRFVRHYKTYPPFLPECFWKVDIPIITTQIPGLEIDLPKSKMDLLVSEMTSPAVGIWLKKRSKCVWITLEQQSAIGNNGITISEDQEKKRLTFDLTTPMVREPVSYHGSSTLPSWDVGANLKNGDEIELAMDLFISDCTSISDFYSSFGHIRQTETQEPDLSESDFPLSQAWDLIESLYNKGKWSERFGYYHAGFIPPFIPADTWSAGWTGGLALSYALLCKGNSLSRERALRNLEFFFRDDGQSETGIFYATSDGINWGGDNYFNEPHIGSRDWIHVRRCGDYLYFLIKHFRLLDSTGESEKINAAWREKTRKCADALCKVWKDNQHFGQYINPLDLKIRIGNSDAGSIIPAALAATAEYFGEKQYLDIAQESLGFYYQDFLAKGFTAGGPLETLCAPDSESALNLLESLVVLYEITNDKDWLTKAHDFSNYVFTWFYRYNVKFPSSSFYGQVGIKTRGSIMASAQNRCSVPNICTLSGDVIWRLFRYTNDIRLMHLIQECVHNAQQYVSRKDNPIRTLRGECLPNGSMHECIQTGDWSGPMGEIPYEYPTSWTEVAHLLSICELPGIYVDLEESRLFCLDHVQASIINNNERTMEIQITNNSAFPCVISLFAENRKQRVEDRPDILLKRSVPVEIPQNSTTSYTISK